MKKTLAVIAVAVLACVVGAGLVLMVSNPVEAAASPCLDLGRCAWAAEAYCEQIEGANASGARLVITQRGNAGCEMCCDNGVCATLDCF